MTIKELVEKRNKLSELTKSIGISLAIAPNLDKPITMTAGQAADIQQMLCEYRDYLDGFMENEVWGA